jgi:hypothetical protein
MLEKKKLQVLKEHITRKVCNVKCFVTKQEADELERLEKIVGETWDAINGEWAPLDRE